jgi:phosphatidylglycerol:prolipoprotein diacylglycerol transferase
MHPILFRLGGLTVHTYGTLLAVGILLGLWLAQRRAPAAGLDPDRVWNLGVYMVLAALGGAKVWLILADWEFYRANPGEIFSLGTLQAGGVWFGGILTALAVGVIYTRRNKMKFLPVGDVCVQGVALGHVFGRLGCFSAGCCWGKPTTRPWSIVFHSEYAHQLVGTPLGIHLHPTQLYESAANLLIFLILLWVGARKKFTGQIFGTYLLLYGIARGTIEFFRGDPGRTMLFGGSVSIMQLVCVAFIVTGSWLLLRGAPQGSAQIAGARAPRAV